MRSLVKMLCIKVTVFTVGNIYVVIGRLTLEEEGQGKDNWDACQRMEFNRCLTQPAKTHTPTPTHPHITTTLKAPTINAQKEK